MLITQIDAFGAYQREEAWTWEHQALLHARAVAGAPELRARFEALRMHTLERHVRRDTLRAEVRDMRERMRRELSRAQPGLFDLKQDRGGIADIEFLAQYWALRHAERYPAVALYSDTIRQLETLASGDLVPQENVDVLVDAYRRYRARGHQRSLRDEPTVLDQSEFAAERARVTALCGCGIRRRGIITRMKSAPLIQPNAQNEYVVTSEDLPLSCPMPQMQLWNSHRACICRSKNRLGEMPLLQRRVSSAALSPSGAPTSGWLIRLVRFFFDDA
jgi:hypothetical protein